MFARAAAKSNKVIVFFYGEGIHNANAFTQPPGDEINIVEAWQQLAEQQEVQLLVCATAAVKRGVITEEDATADNAFNLKAPFIAGGLAEFSQLTQRSDHLLQF